MWKGKHKLERGRNERKFLAAFMPPSSTPIKPRVTAAIWAPSVARPKVIKLSGMRDPV